MDRNNALIQAVWEKGIAVEGVNAALYRKDACGAWIKRDLYNDNNNPFGWVIDHIYPQSLGGGDELENLRPLQVQNNLSKSNYYPSYIATMTAEGARNVPVRISMIVSPKLQDVLNKKYGK